MSYFYVEAPNYVTLPADQPSIFLGGGITGVEDWQSKACKVFEGFGDITVCNPRRKSFNMNSNADESIRQISWEHHYLDQVSQVLFWFSVETIQPIVLFELGARLRECRWRPELGPRKKQPIFIGRHPDYPRKLDVYQQCILEGHSEQIANNLDDLLKNVLNYNRLCGLVH